MNGLVVQVAWIDGALKAAVEPWKICYFHRLAAPGHRVQAHVTKERA
jgi:hypothetical protein